MILFEEMWQVLYEHGACAYKEEGTRRLWEKLRPEQQERIFTTITTKLKEGKFVQYDPIRAIKENTPKVKMEVISYDEHYRRYGTDAPQDGFKMVFLKDQHKTIYVKSSI